MPVKIPKIISLAAGLLLCSLAAHGQSKYWVFFRDKDTSGFNPYRFFDAKTIARRQLEHIPIYDYSDIPVKRAYVLRVSQIADSMGNVSRWFNAMGVWADQKELARIQALPFVKAVQPMMQYAQPAEYKVNTDTLADDSSYRYYQIHRMQGELFAKKGINGKGVRIAVLDVGFKGANKHLAFADIFKNGQIVKTYDFVRHSDFVYGYGSHGTMVLSCIAGKYNGADMGLAPKAEFLLERTERDITELKEEEDNWVAGAEWADQNGADIISTSLGYTFQRYFIGDMNGRTSLIALGANMAARKGMLVLAAAGNDGTSNWKYICTPADADSVLAVGGTDPLTNYHVNFSSYGPSADGRIKPNVVAPAEAWVATPKNYNEEEGTSFSTPLVAGFAACVKQLHPEYTVMQLFHEIEKSGQLYPYYDYAHGYGTPQASYFISGHTSSIDKPFEITTDDDSVSITMLHTNTGGDKTDTLKKLYYHIADSTGYLLEYAVIRVEDGNVIRIGLDQIPPDGILRVYYQHFIEEKKF